MREVSRVIVFWELVIVLASSSLAAVFECSCISVLESTSRVKHDGSSIVINLHVLGSSCSLLVTCCRVSPWLTVLTALGFMARSVLGSFGSFVLRTFKASRAFFSSSVVSFLYSFETRVLLRRLSS